ncbi:MAG: hypothetical protein ACN2B6_01100 [Rickettsiales bacterium]
MYAFDLTAADYPAQTIHMNEAPDVSPCRDCEYRDKDKDEFPACINCIKRGWFRSIPVNLDIKHDINLPRQDITNRSHNYTKSRTKTYRGKEKACVQVCAICGEPAEYNGFKDQFKGYLCHKHYMRFGYRWRTHGRITREDGTL